MRFGVFYELQLPKPWDEDSEYQLVQEAIEQVQLADQIGIEHAWAVEHHFLEEYSHCSASEVFLSALAAKTLHDMGYTNVASLAGGYQAWRMMATEAEEA